MPTRHLPKPSPPPNTRRAMPPHRYIPLALLLLVSLPYAKPDAPSDRSALLSLRSSIGPSLPWNPATPFCSWRGVTCLNGTVIALRLPASRLLGPIPPRTLGNLTSLRTLSLRFNSLSGPLPPDLSSCSLLRNLFLRRNRLSGDLLPLLPLSRLARLDLAGNLFSGHIPPALSHLRHLSLLHLDHNNLTGALPDLPVPDLNVSFNGLRGPIPPSLLLLPPSAFLGTTLCGAPLPPCTLSPPPAIRIPLSKTHKLSGGQIAGITIACIVGSIMLALFLLVLGRRCCSGRKTIGEPAAVIEEPKEFPEAAVGNSSAIAAAEVVESSGNAKRLVFFGRETEKVFDLEELLRASAEVLGKGTFGTTYKAVLEMGMVVAVKRLKEVELSEREFVRRVEGVGRMEHPNVVRLKAYYYSKDEKLLVHEYMPLGSLSAFLHGSRSSRQPISWERRLNIAIAAGRGIEYIHSTGPTVAHGNIRSSNILLDKSSCACVSDHALAQLARPTSISNRDNGYCAEEVTEIRRISQKADVYSFGVLLLELLTGKAPAQALGNEEGLDLPRWVKSNTGRGLLSVVFDPELAMDLTVEDRMVELLQLGLDCTAQFPDSRPTMSKVVAKMEGIRKGSLIRPGVEGGSDGYIPTQMPSLVD